MKAIILVISAITLIALSAPQASAKWGVFTRAYDPDTKGYTCGGNPMCEARRANRRNANGHKQYRYKRTRRTKNKE